MIGSLGDPFRAPSTSLLRPTASIAGCPTLLRLPWSRIQLLQRFRSLPCLFNYLRYWSEQRRSFRNNIFISWLIPLELKAFSTPLHLSPQVNQLMETIKNIFSSLPICLRTHVSNSRLPTIQVHSSSRPTRQRWIAQNISICTIFLMYTAACHLLLARPSSIWHLIKKFLPTPVLKYPVAMAVSISTLIFFIRRVLWE